MNFDRSMARCSFCGRYSSEVRRMIAGPGAAYICDECLQLCNEILNDPTPFSEKALELASRPPVVVPAPQQTEARQRQQGTRGGTREPTRTVVVELEQKQNGTTMLLHQIQFYQTYFELHFLWIRPPIPSGFPFVPRLIFFLKDNVGTQWPGDRGGLLLARPELAHDPNHSVYQGNARFQPLPPPEARQLTIRIADPLGQFEEPSPRPWHFEVSI